MTLSTYLQSKAQATERYHADQRPERLLYRLSQAADRCCLDVLASCALPQGAAVVAVGRYAAHSDAHCQALGSRLKAVSCGTYG